MFLWVVVSELQKRVSFHNSPVLFLCKSICFPLNQINGITTENLSLLETKHLVEKSRGKLTMTVLRDNRKFLVTIPEVEDSPPNSEDDERRDTSSELDGEERGVGGVWNLCYGPRWGWTKLMMTWKSLKMENEWKNYFWPHFLFVSVSHQTFQTLTSPPTEQLVNPPKRNGHGGTLNTGHTT